MRQLVCLHLVAAALIGCALPSRLAAAEPADIRAALQRATAWQLGHPSGIDTRDWIIAPLYDGLVRSSLATGDPAGLAAVLRLGTQSGWMPGNRIYHADDHAVGHAWLDVYLMDRTRSERLTPTRKRVDQILAKLIAEKLAFGSKPVTPGVACTDRWTWCDALYMAPPTLARLFTATGNPRYLEFMDREFRATYDALYDPADHLFYRDATFLDKKTPGGRKTFWSRGNGWVYGGLALLLEHLPDKHPTRPFYENLFREMTGAILAAQQPDGLWRPSLLDADQIPLGETSGSGFFLFGMAWGVNHGLIDRTHLWPAITRGWDGLMTRIREDGQVGYVQPVGSAPDTLGPNSIQDYGTGAFLLAGSELLRALGAAAPGEPSALLAAAESTLAAEAKSPRAYARLVPERMDDLAWENDKVAFRVYGPALRAAPEDSGIDVWCKRVPYPILDKWYRQDLTKKITYHKDHGEGYDGYHVGDTRGCGGLGLWIDGKLVTSDTYISADVLWTAPDVAEFKCVYIYPVKLGDRQIVEHRLTRIRLGERLFEVTSTFSDQPTGAKRSAGAFPHEIAIGLVTQNHGASIQCDPAAGILSVYESLDSHGLGTAIVIHPVNPLRIERLTATDKDHKNDQVLFITRPTADGKVSYRAGFAWAADGEITTQEQWLNYIKKQAAQAQ